MTISSTFSSETHDISRSLSICESMVTNIRSHKASPQHATATPKPDLSGELVAYLGHIQKLMNTFIGSDHLLSFLAQEAYQNPSQTRQVA